MSIIKENNLFDLHDKSKRSSNAQRSAKSLGLSYLGFGRYGLKNKDGDMQVTHSVKNDRLVPVVVKGWSHKNATIGLNPVPINSKFTKWKHRAKYEKSVYDLDSTRKTKEKDYEIDDSDHENSDISLSQILSKTEGKIYSKNEKILKYNTQKYKKLKVDKNKEFGRALLRHIEDSSDVNGFLYGENVSGFNKTLKHDKHHVSWMIRTLDKAFESGNHNVEFPYSVYTGTISNMEKGKEYIFKGYMSTTTKPSIAEEFATGKEKRKNSNRTILQIDLKKGDKAIDVLAAAQASDIEEGPESNEYEHLLPRKTRVKITEGPFIKDNISFYRGEIVRDEDNEEE